MKDKKKSVDAFTKTTTFDDGTFVRTALVVEGPGVGSIDLVNKAGKRIAQVNISYSPNCLIVDVIDVDKKFKQRRFHAFSNNERKDVDFPKDGKLGSVDFRNE